ncbi:MAG: hypothetical protein OXE17_01840 [Chloroflexi bacterium]|nr:hypothetical protein [Chloroflexota bacterium]
MTTPKQMEPNVNIALGNLLKSMMPTCTVLSEHTNTFPEHPGRHADVLVTASGRSPVTVEAEFEPAPEAEDDARERLGLKVNGEVRTIEASVAVRYPLSLETAGNLQEKLLETTLSYCVLYEDCSRFPASGWLQGSVTDLADLVRLVSVPQKEVEQATDILETGIEDAAKILDKMAETRAHLSAKIARLLGMSDVPQTRRMACAILANALVFHERIAGMLEDVNPLLLLGGGKAAKLQDATLKAWGTILDYDFYPIFSIAKDILTNLQSEDAAAILQALLPTARQVNATGVGNAHDLTGRIFQRLIADRKYLATFYTRPASATLLARLAVAKLEGVDWGDAEALGKLRVGDFACGTGALLSAVYDQIAARHELAGGDMAALHSVMMEDVLYGCDVMPSAIHITGSTLSGIQPNVNFEQAHLYTMPYGRQRDGSVKIGSLELLQGSQVQTLFNTSDPALQTGSFGQETAAHVNVDIADAGFDIVIMNPPFTRNVTREGATADAVAAAFAAFEATDQDQKDMANRLGSFKLGGSYHGNAGLATAFVHLADKKLKPGGVLALVLPLTAASGTAWSGFREMLSGHYCNISVFSIAANGKDMSFSSDTGMAECLVIANKAHNTNFDNQRPTFISLTCRPINSGSAWVTSNTIIANDYARRIEDGPYGGTAVMLGEGLIGEMLTTTEESIGTSWGAVRVRDYTLAQVAYSLAQSQLWLPARPEGLKVNVAELSCVGKLGTYHLDIIGAAPRGPFAKLPASPTATYPALWNHDAKKETKIVCLPDSSLQVRPGLEEKATTVWNTATRLHLNLDFTFGSQALAVAFTDQPSVGGRVWPNVIFDNSDFEKTFAVWGNSTIGLLCWWWHSNRQQSSKAGLTIRSAETLPVLDFRTLTDKQLAEAEKIFEEFRDKELMPAYLADADPNRALLDYRVICDLLGFDESIYQGVRRLAQKWCNEPSVHGGKARPKDATFIMQPPL